MNGISQLPCLPLAAAAPAAEAGLRDARQLTLVIAVVVILFLGLILIVLLRLAAPGRTRSRGSTKPAGSALPSAWQEAGRRLGNQPNDQYEYENRPARFYPEENHPPSTSHNGPDDPNKSDDDSDKDADDDADDTRFWMDPENRL